MITHPHTSSSGICIYKLHNSGKDISNNDEGTGRNKIMDVIWRRHVFHEILCCVGEKEEQGSGHGMSKNICSWAV